MVSAPEGGGKSTFLRTVANLLHDEYAADSGLEVICASCADVSEKYAADLCSEVHAAAVVHEGGEQQTEEGLLETYIDRTRRLLGVDGSRGTKSGCSKKRVVLVLDDLDCIFDQYSNRRDDDLPYMRTDHLRVFGHHLGGLVRWLSSAQNQSQVVVLGATRRGATQLLRAHTGCPEFERCVELGSPSAAERTSIIDHLLRAAGIELKPLELTQTTAVKEVVEAADPVAQWASRVAGLTAGYLPGDLHAVVQRIGLLHRGRQALSLSSDISSAAAWSCALEAVVAIVPRQLQELDVQSGGGTGERRSWADFVGYDEIVADLQRRLASVHRKLLQGDDNSSASAASGRKTLQASTLRGIVIHGPTGCGKTLLASVVAAEVHQHKLPSFRVNFCFEVIRFI
jgi:SpoVK/Ycf46/Vps4 family AAA+-type ATPase